jgi:hypothetical protein
MYDLSASMDPEHAEIIFQIWNEYGVWSSTPGTLPTTGGGAEQVAVVAYEMIRHTLWWSNGDSRLEVYAMALPPPCGEVYLANPSARWLNLACAACRLPIPSLPERDSCASFATFDDWTDAEPRTIEKRVLVSPCPMCGEVVVAPLRWDARVPTADVRPSPAALRWAAAASAERA